eukprot:COSAG02_NODE_10377_length_1955_cov_1.519935_1_plen_344_part_00
MAALFVSRLPLGLFQVVVLLAAQVPAYASPSVVPPSGGLVSFWDFQERSGPFVAKLGRGRYVLEEKSYNPSTRMWSSNNKVQRVQDAPPARPFGEMSASIGVSQMLHVPNTYETAPLLNIHGDDATLTVVAWVKPSPALDNASHYDFGHLVGIWAEPISVRTYVMFVPASSRGRDAVGQVPHLDAEISRTGATMQPLCRWSISYALGASPINHSSWHMLAMTFDGNAIRAFVNGSLDVRPPDLPHRTPNFTQCTERWQNPAPISTWTNRSPGTWGPGGAPASKNKTDFAVGGQRGAPCLDGVKCSGMGHPWSGIIGGLAVYDRALECAELRALAQQTGMTPLR